MRSRLSLQARLTAFVTATFAIAVVLGAMAALDRLEASLTADTKASAEGVLGEYLESINGGVASVGVIEENVGTQFFYRDGSGASITEREYFDLLTRSIEAELEAAFGENLASADFGFVMEGDMVAGTDSIAIEGLAPGDATAVTFVGEPIVTGPPSSVALGDDVVAVAQTLTFADGSIVDVGVSAPLQPVTDSLDAFTRVVWVAVPLLIGMVAAVSWLATNRALRPVQSISERARAITADRLADRVPVPGSNDEIRELAETVNAMLDRIEAAQHRQRRLVSDASHELRSPIAASRVQLEVALAANDVGDWRHTALTVLDEQQHLSALVDDLLTLSRLDEGDFHPGDDIDIAHLIDTEVSRARPLRPHVLRRPGLDASIAGDARLLERMVRNLVDNAVRHADREVAISVHRTTDAVVVHVDDDGPGVAEPHRHAVFERFTRLDEARDRDRGGAGLGLSIVREVATAHGGAVSCSEAPLGGARFTVLLPA